VRAVVTGDVSVLKSLLAAEPSLARERYSSKHHATLLHYVAANGVEDALQVTPPNAVEVAEVLLTSGVEVDADSAAYDGKDQTPLSLLVSSVHPAKAGLHGKLVDALCRAGAKIDGPSNDGAPLGTALLFGYPECVRALVSHGARTDNIVFAAAAGRRDAVLAYFGRPGTAPKFPLAEDPRVAAEQALVFASMCGQLEVMELLIDRGTNVNAKPPGSHVTATPLHTAAWQGHAEAVGCLLRRGADPTIVEDRYKSTPEGWARHAGRVAVAELLRAAATTT